MFNNYLKKIYKIDKLLTQLKTEKKELMNVIAQNNIMKQGRYRLVVNAFKVRQVNAKKYADLVTTEQFNDSIVIPVKTAEKYLTSIQLEDIVDKKDAENKYVIKE